jgi:hypothetical protein
MNISRNILSILVIVALVIGFYAIWQSSPKVKAVGGQATTISSATTSTAVAVTSSTRILATTTGNLGGGVLTAPGYVRVYATICNANANPVFISLNTDKAASLSSFTSVIATAAGYSNCFEITDRNQYQGSIRASSTNETTTNVSVNEYVQ